MEDSRPGPYPTLEPFRPRPNTDSGITAHPGWVSDRSSYRGQLLLGAGFCWSCLSHMMSRLGSACEAYAHMSTGLATGSAKCNLTKSRKFQVPRADVVIKTP